MSATHTHEMPPRQTLEEAPHSRRNTSPWLWAALLLVILAAVLVWTRLASQEGSQRPVVDESAAPVLTTPAADTPAVTTTPAPATTRQSAPAVRNREARPLAGNAKPAYPPAAVRSGVQGSVVALLDVDARGNVSQARIESREGQRSRDLDRAVLASVRDWKFEPAMRNGQAVASAVRVPVDFRTEN